MTLAISTSGDAPALTALLRESLDAVLPRDLAAWIATARDQRIEWRRDRVPMDERKPLLLRALNAIYDRRMQREALAERPDASPERVPWLCGPEDSWL